MQNPQANEIEAPLPVNAGAAPAANMDELNLRHYWHVVLERRWLVITAFISVFVLCLIYLF
ncbi:MAG TPA: hypothetical protein VHH73_02525, partial [Verrucomicrobiae bacterium]|nr:hypothetical protein [Verrucomicrobiae bacterium]